jgi:hypothetical protein
MKEKESFNIGLTCSDIQKILNGEELIAYEDINQRIFIKCWAKPNTLKLMKKND